jgi:hypothetical protein
VSGWKGFCSAGDEMDIWIWFVGIRSYVGLELKYINDPTLVETTYGSLERSPEKLSDLSNSGRLHYMEWTNELPLCRSHAVSEAKEKELSQLMVHHRLMQLNKHWNYGKKQSQQLRTETLSKTKRQLISAGDVE